MTQVVAAHPRTSSAQLVDDVFLRRAKELLAIRSTHDRPKELKEALDFIVNQLHHYPDITVERFEHNGVHSILAYRGSKRPERFKILLNGHVDVVAGSDEQFVPYVQGGRLYGRGALDMKLATLALTETFCKVGAEVSYPLGLQITTDEEVGGADGTAWQFEQGVTADFFLTGEQSAGNVVVSAKGICWMRITQKGVASHGAYLWRGDNALLKLTKLVQKIHEIYPVPDEEAWETTASVAQLKATSEGHFNRVPDSAELDVDFRFLPHDPHFASEETARAFIASLDPEATVEFKTFGGAPFAEIDHPLVQKLMEITSRVKGSPSLPIHRHANSDARHLIADPQMRAVEYGVGGALEHSDGEYAELDSVAVFRKSIAEFVLSAGQVV